MNKKVKVFFNICIILLWMGMIFFFSGQIGHQSSITSGNVIRKIVTIFNSDIEPQRLEHIVSIYQPVVRKLAHFSLYAIYGILIYNLIYNISGSNKKSIILTFNLGGIYALSDEFHQLFVPGRTGAIRDVAIDTSGVITGIILIQIILLVYNKVKCNYER